MTTTPIKLSCLSIFALLTLGMSTMTSGQWIHSTASLTHESQLGEAVTVGDYAVFAGGRTAHNGPVSDIVDFYNVATDTWSSSTMSIGRWGFGMASLDGKVYVGGGAPAGGCATYGDVDVWDSSLVAWDWSSPSFPSLGLSRTLLAATTAGSKVLFAGGITGCSSGYTTHVDIYDTVSGVSSTASLSIGRNGIASVSVGDMAFFAGGHLGGGATTDRVDIYDASTGVWSTASLSQARQSLAATTAHGKVFFGGGWRGSAAGPTDRVDIYDVATGTWSTSSLSVPRYVLAAASIGQYVLFGGGFPTSSVVDVYDVVNDSWSTLSLSEARWSLTATSVGDKVLFAGGYSTTQSSTVDIFTLVLDTDGDGINDDEDECPNSIGVGGTVIIGDCDSKVDNVVFENGCTMSDLIQAVADESSNHGQFVRGVSHLTNQWKKDGILTGKEKAAIVSCAASSG